MKPASLRWPGSIAPRVCSDSSRPSSRPMRALSTTIFPELLIFRRTAEVSPEELTETGPTPAAVSRGSGLPRSRRVVSSIRCPPFGPVPSGRPPDLGSGDLGGGLRSALPRYLGDPSSDPQATARCRYRSRFGHRLDRSRVGDVVRQRTRSVVDRRRHRVVDLHRHSSSPAGCSLGAAMAGGREHPETTGEAPSSRCWR